MTRIFIVAICLIAVACKTTQQTSTTQRSKYYEDLSAHRPKVEEPVEVQENHEQTAEHRDPKEFVEAKYTVNKQLNAVLDSIDQINLTRKFVDGYTIQVYSGLSREKALEVRKDLISKVPQIESSLQYAQPSFSVRAGKYFTRLEAQKDYYAVKKLFSTAIIVPDKIQIK